MGYRERQAHRQQQKAQSLAQQVTPEQRITLPPPTSMNTRDGDLLEATDAIYLLNVVKDPEGLRLVKDRRRTAYTVSTSLSECFGFITYSGSGSASAEAWMLAENGGTALTMYNVGDVIDGGVTATASGAGVAYSGDWQTRVQGSWLEYNKTIIYVNGGEALKWNRASAWKEWSASVSAGTATEIHSMWGIHKFKNRLYLWKENSTKFYYGATDQILGTVSPFDLGSVLGENISFAQSLTRDGGAGPDDYIIFVGVEGTCAVYSGDDPGDAANWSLVGVYKIGKPVSKNGYVKFGAQLIIHCEDDFYFLPDDLQGKRAATPFQHKVVPVGIYERGGHNGIFWNREGLLVFGDGTAIDIKHGFTHSQLQLTYQEPHQVYTFPQGGAGTNIPHLSTLGIYRGRLFAANSKVSGVAVAGEENVSLSEIAPRGGSQYSNVKIYTGQLPTMGRTNLSLINPIIRRKVAHYASTSGSEGGKLNYRVGALYDDYLDFNDASFSANVDWQSVSTTADDTKGQWLALPGSGDIPKVCLEVIDTSSSADYIFSGFNVTISDTGGL